MFLDRHRNSKMYKIFDMLGDFVWGARCSPTIQNVRLSAIFPRNFTKFRKFWGATPPPPHPAGYGPACTPQMYLINLPQYTGRKQAFHI